MVVAAQTAAQTLDNSALFRARCRVSRSLTRQHVRATNGLSMRVSTWRTELLGEPRIKDNISRTRVPFRLSIHSDHANAGPPAPVAAASPSQTSHVLRLRLTRAMRVPAGARRRRRPQRRERYLRADRTNHRRGAGPTSRVGCEAWPLLVNRAKRLLVPSFTGFTRSR